MNTEQAKYDLKWLPERQMMLKAMIREPWQSVEGVQILRTEFKRNAQRIEAANEFLAAQVLA